MAWITGGAILGGALLGSQATKKAGAGQSDAANAANAEQARQFDLSRADQAPYRNIGDSAISSLSSGMGLPNENDPNFMAIYQPMVDQFDQAHKDRFGFGIFDSRADAASRDAQLGRFKDQARQQYVAQHGDQTANSDLLRKFTMQDFQNDPVNQIQGTFMQDEARKAIERRAAAAGGWDSGATLKALTRFGSDYGNQRAGESRDRFIGDQTNVFNRLASVSGIGQTAANTSATLGANFAANTGNNTMQAANARGAAGVAQANSINQGIGTGLNFYQNQQFLNRLGPQQASVQTPSWNPFSTGDFPNPTTMLS